MTTVGSYFEELNSFEILYVQLGMRRAYREWPNRFPNLGQLMDIIEDEEKKAQTKEIRARAIAGMDEYSRSQGQLPGEVEEECTEEEAKKIRDDLNKQWNLEIPESNAKNEE